LQTAIAVATSPRPWNLAAPGPQTEAVSNYRITAEGKKARSPGFGFRASSRTNANLKS